MENRHLNWFPRNILLEAEAKAKSRINAVGDAEEKFNFITNPVSARKMNPTQTTTVKWD